ncbi:hypothetical protein [Butyricicoccus pullicaecorum]|uniref:Uncharacterized protein n=1 Tax=Butyricicoccus pullicaecorum 1.2 TaxID=1203606 RepID=R8W3Y9_9FIRM|nr:hypothetical protein [Butyricicoccus pullicaecorum]EOQ39655.1 hypothetical protein HMPREF1526_00349 [Butyricicoccus pullicaecorum 1.2]SKA56915.1 hypothetical protein SAMN02745978_01053 [Butyricicoccus pullicaecorum DSM 23266]
MDKDTSIIFNFFKSDCTSEFCRHFSIAEKDLTATLDKYQSAHDISDIINELEINLETPIDNVKVTWHHLTTTIDGDLAPFQQYGFLSLCDLLTNDTPLRQFLEQHLIHFDIAKASLIYNGPNKRSFSIKLYDIDKLLSDNLDFSNLNTIDFNANNHEREIYEQINYLYSRLHEDSTDYGGIEGFLWCPPHLNITDYSCIETCPEFLKAVHDLMQYIDPTRVDLLEDWTKRTKSVLLEVVTPLAYTKLDGGDDFLPNLADYLSNEWANADFDLYPDLLDEFKASLSLNCLHNFYLLATFLQRHYPDDRVACIINRHYHIPCESIRVI